MPDDDEPHESQVPARVARESTAGQPLAPDVQAAWEAWSAGVGEVDPATRALLRAAFEAGAEAERRAAR
jgi:hypothetical protein